MAAGNYVSETGASGNNVGSIPDQPYYVLC